jgi:tetratricopeptide (TPR) repeat protein
VPPGFEVLDLLGRGGMAVVYKARALRLNRLVALKMLLPGQHANLEERIRFRLEAEAVAQLQHPNIVQVYEVGEQDGCPYLVLEHVEGGNLAGAVGSGQWAVGSKKGAMQASRLIEILARAVHYAHQRGIIHRDLKPGNILLRRKSEIPSGQSDAPNPKLPKDLTPADFRFSLEDFEPKVSDFGIAKRQSASEHQTKTGGVLGSPGYMAPEQGEANSGRVGPATDVYALGAILYELLTGRPPFQASTFLDTLLLVRSEPPVPPRRLQRGIARDLQTICLKCLAKDPERRYSSAAALADDLERFRKGQAILARPAGGLERGWKWMRRRPAAAALVLVSALAPLALLASSLWYAASLRDQRDEAWQQQQYAVRAQELEAQARNKETRARLLAEQREKDARAQHLEVEKQKQQVQEQRDLADKRRAEIQEQRELAEKRRQQIQEQRDLAEKERRQVLARFRSACAALERVVTTLTRPPLVEESARKKLLEDALGYYQGFLEQSNADPAVRREAASAWARVGDINRLLGNPGAAEKAYKNGLTLQQQVVEECPDQPGPRFDLAGIYNDLGTVLASQGRIAEAETSYRQAISVNQKLADSYPANALYRKWLARNYNNLGRLQQDDGRLADADKSFRHALSLRVELNKGQRDSPAAREDLALVHMNLGVLASAQGKEQVAEQEFRQAIDLLEELPEGRRQAVTNRVNLARCFTNLSAVLRVHGQQTQAVAAARKARDLWLELIQEYPTLAVGHEGLAYACNQLGLGLQKGDPNEAEAAFRQGIETCRKLITTEPRNPDYHSLLGGALHNLAILLAQRSQLPDASRLLKEAIEQQKKALEKTPSNPAYRSFLRNHHLGLARVLEQLEDHVGTFDAAVQLAKVFPDNGHDAYSAACLLARCVGHAGRDRHLVEEQRRQAMEKYSQEAVGLLRQARRSGINIDWNRDPELDPLRGRADFQAISKPNTLK